ncbi:SoxR reducing system RseC family protein [Sporosalibacterium faouarense]|uniref:SoxR reducing system RseC family protein n=1 Tax=Sporosalibacterium faouarense TaxID=516123 RepID=UPI00192C7C0C|nr:SoxR reducing system RseC family protein [Sporosalibacterium faouarense]
MQKIGQIISENGNITKVEIRRVSACGEKCGSCSGGCSSSGMYIEAENPLSGKRGQFVKVEIETSTVMKAALLAYVFPLVMLISGILAGSFIHDRLAFTISSELFSFLFGVGLMIISYGVVKIFDISYKSKGNIKYRITKVL